ncbi:MAG TPA: protein kinase [Polyangiaceae bacterium]
MATLYRARDLTSQSDVAIKVLRGPDGEGARSGHARFLREAKTLRSLEHPAIVRYLDHGVDARVGPFLVMEWLEGEPLDAVLRARGLSPEDALSLTRRLVDALAYCHARGIVHRDVKPSNVILPGGRADHAVLVDFGIALDAEGGTRATQTGAVMGTPRYMAPEQLRSARRVDGKADVFALGCALYEGLTGKHPFGGEDVYSYAARLAAGEAPPVSQTRPAIPEAVSRVVSRMIAREVPLRAGADEALLTALEAARNAVAALSLGGVTAAPREDEEQDDSPATSGTLPTYGEVAPFVPATPAVPEVRGPKLAGRFVGRVRERAGLLARLGARGAVATIWGPPGIGKSRLALEVCHDLVQARPARRASTGFVVDLRDAADRTAVLRAVLAILEAGTPSGGLESDVAAVGRMLRAWGEPVLVFDGADRVLDEVLAIAAAWAHPRVGATVLVTSRARARVEGGFDVELGPLTADSALPLHGPGAELLLFAAGLDEAVLDEAQARAAVHIVEALEGNPLALELAAARIPVLGLLGLAERLDEPLALLLGGRGGAGALSMSDALEWSFQLLSPEEQGALVECALFTGPFSARAAEAVVTPAARTSTVDLLAALRRVSLLADARVSRDPTHADSEVRLVLARTVREFARAKLPEEQATEVGRRRNAYFATWAWGVCSEFLQTGSPGALARLARDAEQVLRVAEDTLGAAEVTGEAARVGLRAAVALEPVVAMRGPVTRYLELLDRGLDAATGRDPLVGHARRVRGTLVGRRGGTDAARADLEEACAIGADCRARDLEAEAQLALGALHQWSQKFDEAARMYRAVLDAPRGGEGLRAEARAMSNLAALAHDEQRLDEADALYEESIALLETIGDLRIAAFVRVNSAVLLQEQGKRTEARARYARSVEALTALGDDRFLGITLGNLAMLDFEVGELASARARAEKGRTLLARAGDMRSEALAVGRLSAILAMSGLAREALASSVLAERMSARHDAAVRGTVRLLRAFVDVAKAREARERGDLSTAENALMAARSRVRDATTSSSDQTAVTALSDDARTALRVLESWMATP